MICDLKMYTISSLSGNLNVSNSKRDLLNWPEHYKNK